MPPKRKPTPASERFRCDTVQGERFHAHTDDVFRYNWWEVFCFPYILCARFWDCCVSLCAGTNQCMVYWMMIQWLVCKITKLTTPNAIIFPYYFYMFCQVILLTVFVVLIVHYFGKTLFIPYFMAYYHALQGDIKEEDLTEKPTVMFRKYCFRKSEIFDATLETNFATVSHKSYATSSIVTIVLDVLLFYLDY